MNQEFDAKRAAAALQKFGELSGGAKKSVNEFARNAAQMKTVRLRFERISETMPQYARRIVGNLIDAVDALPVEKIDADAEIDVSDCAETILAGMSAARADMTEAAVTTKDGKTFLTFERLMSIIMALLAIYTAVCAYSQSVSLSETEKRRMELMELAEDVRQIERAQLENEKAILDAICAIYGKLSEIADDESQNADDNAPDNAHDAPE